MAFGMGFGQIEMDLTETGVTLRNLYGWPGWVIEVDIDWPTWSTRTVRDVPPPRTRSNARRPTDDPELVRRIRKAAEAAKELPRSSIWVVSLALPTPHKKKADGVQLRAATIGTMYNYALKLGLSPKRAISEVYDLPLVEAEGERAQPSRKYERWIEQARKTINPETGRPYLQPYNSELHAPRLWPIGRGHPLEPRRARPAMPEPVREGRYAGHVLTLRVSRTAPPDWAAQEARERGSRMIGPDLVIEGTWSNGEELPPLPVLRCVSPRETPRRVQSLVKELEGRYPGAKVTATVSAQAMGQPPERTAHGVGPGPQS
ncbi:hypothetical protein [Streptomyces sp. WAC01280]|uniref:hypothetical protein n=1 Tax=Streptomyces sp. WAC01280 TaxID=2487424 RepID=UPI000F797A9E|nr:hypothetical protein [Streptomyces sp. WAC01280]RSS53903.1 hypothetical protein EF909_23670 [Streptomyces sp. WAC01280]